MVQAVFFDLFNTLISPNNRREGAVPGYHAIEHGSTLLAGLRQQGIKTAIISNVERPSIIAPLLELVDPDHRFDLILTSGEVGYGKPDPRIFQLALQELQIEPAAAMHIGDDPHADILGALNVGIIPIWFNPGNERWPYPEIPIVSAGNFLEIRERIIPQESSF